MLFLFFLEIIVVVLESEATKISQALTTYCNNPKLKFEFATIPDDKDMGTADSLRHIKDKIEVHIEYILYSVSKYVIDKEPFIISTIFGLSLILINLYVISLKVSKTAPCSGPVLPYILNL